MPSGHVFMKLSYLSYCIINCMNLPCTVGSIKPCRNPVNKRTGIRKVLWNGWYVKITKIMSGFVYVTSTKVVYSCTDIILFLTIKWNRSFYIYMYIYPITFPLDACSIWSLSLGPVFFYSRLYLARAVTVVGHTLVDVQAGVGVLAHLISGRTGTCTGRSWTHNFLVVGPLRGQPVYLLSAIEMR